MAGYIQDGEVGNPRPWEASNPGNKSTGGGTQPGQPVPLLSIPSRPPLMDLDPTDIGAQCKYSLENPFTPQDTVLCPSCYQDKLLNDVVATNSFLEFPKINIECLKIKKSLLLMRLHWKRHGYA